MTAVMNYIKSAIRHGVAIVVAAIATALAGAGIQISPDQSADLESGLTLLGMVIFSIVWALVEKGLKPIWFRFFGEVQPGEVPPVVHDNVVQQDKEKL